VPTTWDETRFVDGEPGDFVVVARRRGDEWYLGAMCDENPRSVSLPLGFLAGGRDYTAHVFRDGDDVATNPQSVVYETTRVSSKSSIDVRLGAGGGLAVRLAPVD
jgi:alpha-glucosidase